MSSKVPSNRTVNCPESEYQCVRGQFFPFSKIDSFPFQSSNHRRPDLSQFMFTLPANRSARGSRQFDFGAVRRLTAQPSGESKAIPRNPKLTMTPKQQIRLSTIYARARRWPIHFTSISHNSSDYFNFMRARFSHFSFAHSFVRSFVRLVNLSTK